MTEEQMQKEFEKGEMELAEMDKKCEEAYQPRPISINNRFIVETYQKEGLRAEVKNGFAMISQKMRVKGLKLLVETHVRDGRGETLMVLPKGSLIYIREEYLHGQPWAKQVFESDAVEAPFLIVDQNYVEFVVRK